MKRRSFFQSVMTLAMVKLTAAQASDPPLSLSVVTPAAASNSLPSPCFEDDCVGAIIKVIGIGAAGCNAIEAAMQEGIRGVDFIAINSDAQALERSSAPCKILLRKTGEGVGARPEVGRTAADAHLADIRAVLSGVHMAFIVAGMGGGTGTGAAPVVTKVAREMGILTVGIVSTPFLFEGRGRMDIATAGVAELVNHLDSLVVVPNDKLMAAKDENTEVDVLFERSDKVLISAVRGIAEIITCIGIVGVDLEDVRTVMGDMGLAALGIGSASGLDRARLAAEQAIASPLQGRANLSAAQGLLVAIASAKSQLKMKEVNEVMNAIKRLANDDAHIIFGAIYDDAMGDALSVTLVTTGLGPEGKVFPSIKPTFDAVKKLVEAGIDPYDIPLFLRSSIVS